jgi:putative proteasome-type protease
MTFGLGIKVREGLVGLADTRVTIGIEVITARKVYTHQRDRQSLFLMTSGLRSVRDKALTYFDDLLADPNNGYDRMFKAVNAFAAQVRRVSQEDRAALEAGGFTFNIHALVGGQCENDTEQKLYLVYPAGNWARNRAGHLVSDHRLDRLRQTGARPHIDAERQHAIRVQGRLSGVRLHAH